MNIKPLNKWISGLTRPLVIAGPCSAETKDQVLKTAHAVKDIPGVRIFRSGIWKPRTRPNCFEGVGEEGLSWVKQVKEETGLLTTVEVANARHTELALKAGIDILWIGARTTVNPFSVQEIADAIKGTNIPVMIKNPINADLSLWIGAIERIHGAGIDKLVAIHRGFSTADKTHYRNLPIWKIPMELKRNLPDLPIICDPSHITGNRHNVERVCQKALDIDMDGFMVETHPTPDEAWSDAAQQVTPEMLSKIVENISVKTEFSPDYCFENDLAELRSIIDRIDLEILESLKTRFDIVEKIGSLKIKNNITALQIHRMDEMLRKRMEQADKVGLRSDFAKEFYNVIHEESVKKQTEMMLKSNDKDNKRED
jgi:chorismate mutase